MDLLLPQSKVKKNLYTNIAKGKSNDTVFDDTMIEETDDDLLRNYTLSMLNEEVNNELRVNEYEMHQKIQSLLHPDEKSHNSIFYLVPTNTSILFLLSFFDLLSFCTVKDLLHILLTCKAALNHFRNYLSSDIIKFNKKFQLRCPSQFQLYLNWNTFCTCIQLPKLPAILDCAAITVNISKFYNYGYIHCILCTYIHTYINIFTIN